MPKVFLCPDSFSLEYLHASSISQRSKWIGAKQFETEIDKIEFQIRVPFSLPIVLDLGITLGLGEVLGML